MLPEDAVGAALYRYDYCTAKYSLTGFINGRSEAPSQSSNFNTISNSESSNIIVVVAIFSVLSFSLLTVLVIKKRKER